MTQQISGKYIVAYGVKDKFEVSEQEARALIDAADKGMGSVKFSNRVFSTRFTWIMPKEDTEENKENKVFSHPFYQEYRRLKSPQSDGEMRRKMYLEKMIDKIFPYEKFASEWEEAQRMPISTDIVLQKEEIV